IIEALFDKSKISYEIDDRKILLKSKEIDSGPTITETNKIIEKPQMTVTGTVTGLAGMPMLGVNITVKDANVGTVTDFDGNYSINISNANSILVFSYIGYETKEVAIAGKTVINVTLNESASALDEVVVTALGIKKESKKLAYA